MKELFQSIGKDKELISCIFEDFFLRKQFFQSREPLKISVKGDKRSNVQFFFKFIEKDIT